MANNTISQFIETNSFVDEGNGYIRVKGGLTLTDDSVQRNGTKYDVKSLDLSEYDGTLFANHGDEWGNYTIEKVIGKLVGVGKKGKRVVAEGIQYAVNANPLATLAYNMTREGFLNSFSIGTRGDMPKEDGTYENHSMYEVSQVGIPNNLNAKLNQVALNSIEQAKTNGLDTSELEKALHMNDSQEAEEKVETEEKTEKCETTCTESKCKGENMADVKEDVKEETTKVETENETTEAAKNAFSSMLSDFKKEMEEIKKNAFDTAAKEPGFVENKASLKSYSNDWQTRVQQQVDAFRKKDDNMLRQINEFNLGELKKEGKVRNAIDLDSFGNFVSCPELLTEIQGCRNNYQSFVDTFRWTETTSLTTSWVERVGDINAQPVALCGENKQVSEYGANVHSADLELFAAITPVCNSATKFLVVDVLGDIAAGYRNDYDRKRAEAIVGRLEQAVDANGNSISYTDASSDEERLQTIMQQIASLCSCTPNGVLIMSCATEAEILRLLMSTANGSAVFAGVVGEGALPRLFGRRVVVVPDDILPNLAVENDTRTVTLDGDTVTVQHAIFYVDPSNFSGRTSGGLMYNLFDQGTYHVGANVLSAVERNEILIRGEYFRGGFVLDNSQVAGLINGVNTSS